MAGDVDSFCRMILRKYGSPHKVRDGILAEEFASYFLMSPNPTLMEFHLLGQRVGIDVSPASLPQEIAAHHYLDRSLGKYRLEYQWEQWPGTSEFRVAHDLYEIVQERFQDLVPRYRAPWNPKIPTCMAPRANRFAAALVMNARIVRHAVVETGLDIVLMHHRFYKAYSSVAIRIAEVLRDARTSSIQFLVAIYEPQDRDALLHDSYSPSALRARYVVKTHDIRISRRRWRINAPRYPRHLLPHKGDGVVPGSLVDSVIAEGVPFHVERVWGLDLWGFNDLTALAVPVFWNLGRGRHGRLAKVILTVVPHGQAQILQPQLRKVKPIVIKERFQLV